ncbi:hypothetical protein N2152v2_010524 [Parachlorella kessleri]
MAASWTSAPGGTPYEPLERAIQVINRVLTVGERAGWGAGTSGADGGQQQQRALPERWVQFGSAASAHVDIIEELGTAGSAAAAAPAAWVGGERLSGACNDSCQGSTGRSLQDYLAVPPEEYSLLDPKWIGRQEGGTFKLTIPLWDLLGVDLTPEIHVQAGRDKQTGNVTLVGTQAALGRPELDSSFRLQLVAVLSQLGPSRAQQPIAEAAWAAAGAREGLGSAGASLEGRADSRAGQPGGPGIRGGGPLSRLRRIRRPQHLPGRPVYRLRKLVARARGGQVAPPGSEGAWDAYSLPPLPPFPPLDDNEWAPASGMAAVGSTVADGADWATDGLAEQGQGDSSSSSGSISWPQRQADEDDAAWLSEAWNAELPVVRNGASRTPPQQAVRLAGGASSSGETAAQQSRSTGSSAAAEAGSFSRVAARSWDGSSVELGAAGAPAVTLSPVATPASVTAAQLGCRVSVRIALKVPPPARVVPNALLGTAGRLLLRAVLVAVLPNFLDLLASDYKRWAAAGGTAGASPRDIEGAVGELFADVQQDPAA